MSARSELRSHAASPAPLLVLPSASTPGSLARRVPICDSAEGFESFNVLAFASAAEAALRLALSRPGAVRALVLAAAAPPTDPSLAQRLAELKVPTLVLLGTRDPQAPPALGRQWRELQPGCHVVFVYDAGHDLASDRPDAFADAVIDFTQDPGGFLVNRRDGAVRYE